MSFKTFSPQSELEALELLNIPLEGMFPIAGGTNVLVNINQQKLTPRALVDLSRINEWKKIELTDEVLEIGSLVTHAELEESLLIKNSFPALAMAAASVGSPQIRNRGTLGGNLQSASPAADCVPPLLAYEAILTLVSLSGKREVSVADFLLGAGKTVLRPNELISKISIKKCPKEISIFRKTGLRKALAISLVNLAVSLEIDGDSRCSKARVAFGAIAPTPIRVKRVEAFLEGRIIESDIDKALSEIVEQEISPITDIRASSSYRRYLARVLLLESLFNLMRNREAYKWPKLQ